MSALDQRGELQRRVFRAVENFTLQRPQLTRRALGVLRSVKPVLRVGDIAIVTRHADVQEVLSRDDDFTVGLNTPKMEAIAGRFILGLQHTPTYEHDVSVLRLAVPRSDMPRVESLVDGIVEEIFASTSSAGRMDVVPELFDLVPARLSDRYFGAPGPDERTFARWGRILFRELFYNLRNDPAISGPAAATSAELRHHVDSLIAARTANRNRADDVLGRMLQLKADGHVAIDDTWIRTYLIGLIVGMLPLTSKASTLALNVMLDRPGMLASAQAAARAGDDELVWRYVSEAMRIAPQSPGQFRLSEGDWIIGAGSGRRHTIASGTRVFAATQAAMFDRRVFTRPAQVRTDRPASPHLHFGYGLHSCYGRYISFEAQLPRMFKALLRQPNLRRADGATGRLRWKDPFPESLSVEFDPS